MCEKEALRAAWSEKEFKDALLSLAEGKEPYFGLNTLRIEYSRERAYFVSAAGAVLRAPLLPNCG
jgi:hypothetical protein